MTKLTRCFLLLFTILFVSCSEYFKDDFELDIPSSERIDVNFPSLVTFEIRQTVTPDRQGLTNEVSNTFVLANELNQPLSQLKFGINIFDSSARFQKNVVVSYVDSLQQTLSAFGKTNEKLFNTSFDSPLKEEMVEIFILEQDVLDNHPFNGVYIGEASYYQKPDSLPLNIPFIHGFIDYKGDVQLRASGNQIDDYNISGRLSSAGQFIGQSTSSTNNTAIQNLINSGNLTINPQLDSLRITLVPSPPTSSTLDSISLVLIRN